jgi:hypothetical protein
MVVSDDTKRETGAGSGCAGWTGDAFTRFTVVFADGDDATTVGAVERI